MAKTPKTTVDLDSIKQTPVGEPPSANFISWSFTLLDYNHPKWCFSRSYNKTIAEVLKKLGEIEGLSIPERREKGCHFVKVEELKSEAKQRLAEICQDDIDELYSVRLTGICRVFAIQHKTTMRIVWWDTNHEICPSQKKNT